MFAMCPDGGPNRIFRFTDLAGLPDRYVALLDRERNVLTIRKDHFDKLSSLDKQRVFTCRVDAVTWVRCDPIPPVLVFETNPVISVPPGAIID